MISNPPSSSSQFNFAVFASVIHHFRDQVFVCQRAARAYIACRHARFEALKHWWVEEEKIWINGMKLKRRTTEHENSAVDNHAPHKLRGRLIWMCVNREMRIQARRLLEFDKKVKENEMKIKQVGVEDALAVVRGEFHSHTHERIVLVRPYYTLYSKIKKEGRMRWMVQLAHKKMEEFRKELDADTGIAMLVRADDCLYDLKEEIENFGFFDPNAESSEEEEDLDDLYFGGLKGYKDDIGDAKGKKKRVGIMDRARRRAGSNMSAEGGGGGEREKGGGGFDGEALKRRIQSLNNKVDYNNINVHMVDGVEW